MMCNVLINQGICEYEAGRGVILAATDVGDISMCRAGKQPHGEIDEREELSNFKNAFSDKK